MKRILIVDDDPDHRLYLRTIFEAKGYGCEEARDCWEALVKLKTEHISLVLTDLHMRGMSGLQLIEQMRELSWSRSIPVMIMTSQFVSDISSQALQLGVCAVIEKPYDSPKLLKKIESFIGTSEILCSPSIA